MKPRWLQLGMQQIGSAQAGRSGDEPHLQGRAPMRLVTATIAGLAALLSTQALAQAPINLSGRYICVRGCAAGVPGESAFITMNGTEMNIVNEAGASSRAWVDGPGHIWVANYDEGAIFSPNGLVIQFDKGAVWQRALPPPAPPPVPMRFK
jgi:hypothetical protein